MPDVTIVYWRDIPAQVLVGRGRGGAKAKLSERFEQAIDRAAMKAGLAGTDDYLGEWRKVARRGADGDPQDIAAAEAQRIEAEYGHEKLRALVENFGRVEGGA